MQKTNNRLYRLKMGFKLKSPFTIAITALLVLILAIYGCASIQTPLGGPRDHTPPKLLQATPANETRFFKANEIKLDFDEYFKLVNQFQEITISPAMEKTPDYKVRQRSLIIHFKDTLQKNTTYVINFGKSIVDVNEGNILQNFTYVFSTGGHIDSLSISGTVTDVLTQEKVKEATVMLFTEKQDSAYFGKKKPSLYTVTDTSGNYSLRNLHEGNYYIYALKETGANKIYDNENELIAYKKKPVRLYKDTMGLDLAVFKQIPEKFRITEKRFTPEGTMFFSFNQALTQPGLKINYPAGLDDQKIVDISKTKDSAMVYLRNFDFDSVSVSFTDKNKILDTVYLRKQRKETFKHDITLFYNLNDQLLKPGTDLSITSNLPIQSIDRSLIFLSEDSINVTSFTIQRDTADLKKFTLKYKWRPERSYQLVFNEGTFINIYGDKSKRLNKLFSIDKPENYGTIILKVALPDSNKTYLVELLNNRKQVLRSDILKKSANITYKDYLADKYYIRVIYDTNANGKWDSGSLKQKTYPENIWLSPTPLIIRPNWENNFDLPVPKEILTP